MPGAPTCSQSTADLRSVSMLHDVVCAWICLHAVVYCIDPQDKHLPAVRAMLSHQVWEAQCKDEVLHRFSLTGQTAVIAGLFFGDWLPALSEAVGESGF
eukprot:2048227-Pleurochrysis_carterae.AAC.1